jgi:hypothetical protein
MKNNAIITITFYIILYINTFLPTNLFFIFEILSLNNIHMKDNNNHFIQLMNCLFLLYYNNIII